MPTRFNIWFNLEDYGWATTVIEDEFGRIEMPTTYLRDSLLELYESAIKIAEGERKAGAIFLDEPGEHWVEAEYDQTEGFIVKVTWYEEWKSWGNENNLKGTLIKTTKTTPRDYIEAIKVCKEKLEKESSRIEYKRKWRSFQYPIRVARKLETI